VGIGFAATENVIYILSALVTSSEDVVFATALYRGVATVALHAAASAVAGRGIWRARYGGSRRWAVGGVLAAIMMHMIYNGLAVLSVVWATLVAASFAVIVYMGMKRRVAALDAVLQAP
jgi:RsiW-degrading membrane proteinase PrsW (M82 family)